MPDWEDVDASSILGVLTVAGVDFVVIGGIAAVLHGSARVTQDLDVCFGTSPGNLRALGRALTELEARPSGTEDAIPFVPDERSLRAVDVLRLATRFGRFDVLARPSGAPPFRELRGRAQEFDLGAFVIRVASIDDLIAMKAAAGRPKDLADISELEAIKRLRRHR